MNMNMGIGMNAELKKYFSFQMAMDNRNEYEIIFLNSGKKHGNDSTNPKDIINFFNIDENTYFSAAEKYNAKIKVSKHIPYKSVRFESKKDARKFIREYLISYIAVLKLMNNNL